MKLIVAIIRPDRLNEVLEALYRADVTGLTVSRVLGHGGETDRVETYRGTTVKMELQEKVRLEIGVSNRSSGSRCGPSSVPPAPGRSGTERSSCSTSTRYTASGRRSGTSGRSRRRPSRKPDRGSRHRSGAASASRAAKGA